VYRILDVALDGFISHLKVAHPQVFKA